MAGLAPWRPRPKHKLLPQTASLSRAYPCEQLIQRPKEVNNRVGDSFPLVGSWNTQYGHITLPLFSKAPELQSS